jgi:hypothetical protein
MTEPATRAQLVPLVARIMSGKYSSEADQIEDVRRLERAVPHPAVADLIFWSKPELTPDEVVDEALAYRPFVL